MKITICSSSTFYDKLWAIKDELEKINYEVLLPSMEYNDKREDAKLKIELNLIRVHFAKIEESDAIYVANYDKNGVKGYIGGNCFLEIGKAFDCGLPIFMLNDIPEMLYKDELTAMQPIIIGCDWKRINDYLVSKQSAAEKDKQTV